MEASNTFIINNLPEVIYNEINNLPEVIYNKINDLIQINVRLV